jgi:putative ABC transport system permease protein
MDLAVKDIRRHLGKFLATIVGVGLLLTIVLVMNGIYQGNIADGVWLIENTAADLWVVERGRGGPFNESSRMPTDAYRSVAATPGVARASPLITYAAQREIGGRSQQFTIIGYDVFEGLGGPGRIVAGRPIRAAHYELVADAKLGLALGDRVRLATHDYTVVGITREAVDSGGNPLVYLSLPDAQAVQYQQDNRALEAARAASLARLERSSAPPPTRSTRYWCSCRRVPTASGCGKAFATGCTSMSTPPPRNAVSCSKAGSRECPACSGCSGPCWSWCRS